MSKTDVTKSLEKVLADTYALYLKTQNYHWNVTGGQFKLLHVMFEEQYRELAEAVDVIAERIRALGVKAPGSFSAFAKLTSLEEPNSKASSDQMLKDLIVGHEAVLATIQKTLKISQKEGDEATADVMIGRIEAHDKAKWMLSATL